MSGFPGRPSFDELGGVKEDRYAITHPKQQGAAAEWTDIAWQVAGLGKVGPLVRLTVDAAGQKVSGGEAWNTNDESAKRVTITHTASSGVYVIASPAASFYDWRESALVPVVFYGAIITAESATSVRPPTYTRDSATQITVYTWNAAGVATDMAFTIFIP